MTETKSPIEEKFFQAAKKKIPGLIPQMPVTACGRPYRLDFAKIVKDSSGKDVLKVAIELDGYEYHSSIEQRNHDVQRDRDLMYEGWQIIRFTGSHINRDVDRCVDEAAQLIEKWSSDRGPATDIKRDAAPSDSSSNSSSNSSSSQISTKPEGKKQEGRKRESNQFRNQREKTSPISPKAILALALAIVVLGAIVLTSGWMTQGVSPARSSSSPPDLLSLIPDPAGPQSPGTKVVWTAKAEGGADLVYRFWLKGPSTDGGWRDATGWIEENRWTWVTTSYDQGQNQVKAEVRERESPESQSSYKVQDYSLANLNMPPNITELKSDSYSPQDAGTSIVWMARATDPDGDPIQYRFLLKGPGTGHIWKDITGWAKDDSWKWKASSKDVGKNQIQVQARDGKHAEKEDVSRTVNFTISSTNQSPSISDLTPDKESPQPIGSRITWRANASDKEGDTIYYKFWLKGPSTDGEWSEETGWIESDMWSWNTASLKGGSYQVKAQAKDDENGEDDSDSTTAGYVLTEEAAYAKEAPVEAAVEAPVTPAPEETPSQAEVQEEAKEPQEVAETEEKPPEETAQDVQPEESADTSPADTSPADQAHESNPAQEATALASSTQPEQTESTRAGNSQESVQDGAGDVKVAGSKETDEPQESSQEAQNAPEPELESSTDAKEAAPSSPQADSEPEASEILEKSSEDTKIDSSTDSSKKGASAQKSTRSSGVEVKSSTDSDAGMHQDDGSLYLGGDTGERILSRIAPAGSAPTSA